MTPKKITITKPPTIKYLSDDQSEESELDSISEDGVVDNKNLEFEDELESIKTDEDQSTEESDDESEDLDLDQESEEEFDPTEAVRIIEKASFNFIKTSPKSLAKGSTKVVSISSAYDKIQSNENTLRNLRIISPTYNEKTTKTVSRSVPAIEKNKKSSK